MARTERIYIVIIIVLLAWALITTGYLIGTVVGVTTDGGYNLFGTKYYCTEWQKEWGKEY